MQKKIRIQRDRLSMGCYYKILGISAKASQEEIKSSFRGLAFRWHPDRNPEDPEAAERFREALKAYETLVDPQKRSQYDRKRGYDRARTKAKRRKEQSGPNSKFGTSYDDVLQDAFGIHVDRSVSGNGGYDLRFDLQVPKSVLMDGAYEDIEYRRAVYCPGCSRGFSGASLSSCTICKGIGEVEEKCSVRIWIPPGAKQGMRLRVPGAGDHVHPSRTAGDLVVLLFIIEGH